VMRTIGVSCTRKLWIASLRGTGGGRSMRQTSTWVMRVTAASNSLALSLPFDKLRVIG
jgi:hypothetical protein